MVLAFDARVALVAAALTLGTALLFGLVPAWQAASVPLAEMTSAGGRGSTRRAGGLRAALVVGEVAAAVLLAVRRRPARSHAGRAEPRRSRLPRRATC